MTNHAEVLNGTKGIAQFLNCGLTQAWIFTRQPDFPPPLLIGKRKRWLTADVRRWLHSKRASA